MAYIYHIIDHMSDSKDLIGSFATYEDAEVSRQAYACANIEKTWDGRPTCQMHYGDSAPALGSFVVIFGKQFEVVELKKGYFLNEDEKNIPAIWATMAQVI